MAKRTIHTLSPSLAAHVPEVVRRVMSKGVDTAITPYGGNAQPPLWFVIDSHADDGANVSRWNYTGKLYTTPELSAPISTTQVKARNTNEGRNYWLVRGGLTVGGNACGSVTGIQPARPNVAHLVIGRIVISGQLYYLFAFPNDPIIKQTP